MAKDDHGTPEQEVAFVQKTQQFAYLFSQFISPKFMCAISAFLADIICALEGMTVFYQYGDGELPLGSWDQYANDLFPPFCKDSVDKKIWFVDTVIPVANSFISSVFGYTISLYSWDDDKLFSLWFEPSSLEINGKH